MGRKVTLLRKK
jgi:hypothetical protein